MVGSSLFGVMADRIGRRHTIVITLLCCALGISNNCVNICLCLSWHYPGNLLGCVMTSAWSYGLTRVLASAGGIGTSITAFTMTLEIIGVRETVPLLPWVTVSTFLANFAAIPTAIGEVVPSLVSDNLIMLSQHLGFSCLRWLTG